MKILSSFLVATYANNVVDEMALMKNTEILLIKCLMWSENILL